MKKTNYIILRGLPASGKSQVVDIISNLKSMGPIKVLGTDELREYVRFRKDVPKDASETMRVDEAFNKKKALVYDFILQLGIQKNSLAQDILEEVIRKKDAALDPKEIVSMYKYALDKKRQSDYKTCIFDATFIDIKELRKFYSSTTPYHAIFELMAPINQIIQRAQLRERNPFTSKSKAGPKVIEGMINPQNSDRYISLDELNLPEFPHINIFNDSTLQNLEEKTIFSVEEAINRGYLFF